MKEKKNEEVKELKVEKVKIKNKVITKDRVISVVIGIVIGVLITSCSFCLCRRFRQPLNMGGPRIQIQDRGRANRSGRYGWPSKREQKTQDTDEEKSNQETDKSSENNTQNNN